MTSIRPLFLRLGLSQYLESFIQEGFETLETLLDITEPDLNALGVKLGHRRILQREIRTARGQTNDQFGALNSPTSFHRPLETQPQHDDGFRDGRMGAEPRPKRKYRRHPKPDPNAPERPPSAYVIFSNNIREELKPFNLSFTEIAKKVGESWQILSPGAKEPFETQASKAKETYHTEMATYKMTDLYTEYKDYLADFKTKNANKTNPSANLGVSGVQTESSPSQNRITSESKENTRQKMWADASSASDVFNHGKQQRRDRVDSTSLVGHYSAHSCFSSPSSIDYNINSTSFSPQGRPLSIPPLASLSSASSSPSSPSIRSNSSGGQPLVLHHRPSAKRQVGFEANQHIPKRLLQREYQTNQNSASGGTNTHSLASKGRSNPSAYPPPFATRSGTMSRSHDASVSSKSSSNSNRSGGSTAPSSHPVSGYSDEERKPIILPPLSAVGLAPNFRSPAPDHIAQGAHATNTDRRALAYGSQLGSRPSFDNASAVNKKYDYLQLPLPYKTSSGQMSLVRTEDETAVGQAFGSRNLPPERTSIKGYPLQQNGDPSLQARDLAASANTPLDRPGLLDVRSMPSGSRSPGARLDGSPCADPLSVLAEAAGAKGGNRRRS